MVHHRRGLRRLLKDTAEHTADELLAAIESDWRTAPLSPPRSAMLEYCVKLTQTPARVVRADIAHLRDVGFADRDILDIVEVTAYYAYANRIAGGLGVPTEDWIPTGSDRS